MSDELNDEVCANCGQLRGLHICVNYSDGPQVSGVTLICPAATFAAIGEEEEASS